MALQVGSSARKLKQAGVNLLAGRALYRAMHPFIPEELGEQFALDDALQHGLLPIVWDSEDRAETLIAYTQMYLKEEIQAEALVRNLPGFARFLPVAALFHGQTLNVTNPKGLNYKQQTALKFYPFRNSPTCWPPIPCGHKPPRASL